MKNKVLKLLLMIVTIKSFGQDTIVGKKCHSQIFSLSPISKKVDKVNGLVFGVGHFENKNIKSQTVNGINLEASPLGLSIPFVLLYSLDDKFDFKTFLDDCNASKVKVNGLNLSSGGFTSNAEVNGLNISSLTRINKMNGISVSGFFTGSTKTNGILISGYYNYSEKLNGLSIAVINKSIDFNGMQIGLYNSCENQMTGIQIGLVNISNKTKGLQIGLLNRNKKRTLPIINF
jgi:hypothetical protein